MNIKSKKAVFIDEVSNYLTCLEDISQNEDESEISLHIGDFEKLFNSYLKKNYTILPNENLKSLISRLNNVQLLPEEKFMILNFKPKTEIELSLLVENIEEKLSKEDIEIILKIFKITLNNHV